MSSHMRAKPGARITIVVLWNIELINDTAAFQAPSCRECIENIVGTIFNWDIFIPFSRYFFRDILFYSF